MENITGLDMMSDRSFRKLRPSFTKEESKFLLELMSKYKAVLIDKNKGFVTVEQRREAWQNICDELNSINPNVHRSCDEVKKRWQNLVYQATKDSQKLKGFYPGESPRISEVSMGILNLTEDWSESDSLQMSNMSGFKVDPYENEEDDNGAGIMISDSPQSFLDDQSALNMVNNTSYQISENSTSPIPSNVRRNSAEKSELMQTSFPEAISQPTFPQRVSTSGVPVMSSQQRSSLNGTPTNISEGLSVTSAPVRSKYLHPAYRDASLSSHCPDSSGVPANKKRHIYYTPSEQNNHNDAAVSEAEHLALERSKLKYDIQKLEIAKEQLSMERQKHNMEREKFAMEMELDHEKLRLERERMSSDRERDRQQLVMEREKFMFSKEQESEKSRLEKEQHEAQRQTLALEREKLSLEISFWRRRLSSQTANHHQEEGEEFVANNVDH